jgi:hypothetical protein
MLQKAPDKLFGTESASPALAAPGIGVGRTGYRSRYTPQLRPDLLHRLWEMKQKMGIPMTKLLDQAVEGFLFRLEA